jgi:hypothetical protein
MGWPVDRMVLMRPQEATRRQAGRVLVGHWELAATTEPFFPAELPEVLRAWA